MRLLSTILISFIINFGLSQEKPFWTVEIGSFSSGEKLPDDFSKKLLKLNDIKIISSEEGGKITYRTDKVFSNKEAQELSRKLREKGFKTRVNHPSVLQKKESLAEGPKEKKWKTGERVEFDEAKKADCDRFIVCIGKYAYDTPQYVKDATSKYKKHELIIRGACTSMAVSKYAYDYATALKVKREVLADGFLGTKLMCDDGQPLHPDLKPEKNGENDVEKLQNKENSRQDGPWLTYHKSGKKFEEGTLKNGKLHGSFNAYHENGNLMAQGNYEEGLKQGVWIWFHTNGNKQTEGSFENDHRIGTWTSYDAQGKIIGTQKAD